MRTIDFSKVLFDALQYSGNDRQNISAETFSQFRDFASSRLREAWESSSWTDLCRIEAFTTTTVDGVSYFIPNADADEVLGVWNKNPQESTKAKQFEYQMYYDGSDKKVIISSGLSSGYYFYRKHCPELNGDLYSNTTPYYKGVQVYFDSGSESGTFTPAVGKPHYGNFYVCTALSTSLGEKPVFNGLSSSSWSKIEIPYVFGSYLSWASAASYFGSESQTNEAVTLEQKANQILEQEYDKQLRQQGQNSKLNMNNTY